METDAMLHLLTTLEGPDFDALLARADRCRHERVGPAVHMRGLIEIGNACTRNCTYCGLRSANRGLKRYRLSDDEVLDAARRAHQLKLPTVVLQAGQDPGWSATRVARLVARIRDETGLRITLSLGEQTRDTLHQWRQAGARRYLLRFETSNPALFARLHPGALGLDSRLRVLHDLRDLDYEVGSGCLIGLPGQTTAMVAGDLTLCRNLDLDMVGIGPYVPHPDTPLAKEVVPPAQERIRLTLAAMAVVRLLCPAANLPITTALQTLAPDTGLTLGLGAGCNVIMPNVTPSGRQPLYQLYPGKPVRDHTADTLRSLERRLADLCRHRATSPGDAPNWLKRKRSTHQKTGGIR